MTSRRLAVLVGAAILTGCAHAAAAEPRADSRVSEAARLITSEDPYERSMGFLRLEAIRDPASADIVRPYLEDANPAMRASAARALIAIERVEAVPVLLTMRGDRDAGVRRAALLGLEPYLAQDDRILPACLEALDDRHPDVRMAAIDIVSRSDDPRVREQLLVRRKREQHRDVKRVLRAALQRIGAPVR